MTTKQSEDFFSSSGSDLIMDREDLDFCESMLSRIEHQPEVASKRELEALRKLLLYSNLGLKDGYDPWPTPMACPSCSESRGKTRPKEDLDGPGATIRCFKCDHTGPSIGFVEAAAN